MGSPAFAAEPPSPACLAKRADIESRLSTARQLGHSREVQGLERALAANKSRCTDASLEAERRRDIAAATKKVAARQSELDEAASKGDEKKMASRQAKLDEAKADLERASRPIGP